MTKNAVVRLCHSAQETMALGECVGRLAGTGQVIALDGPLGAGKTQLVRGLATGAGVADSTMVNSPSYVLLNIYPADPVNPAAKTVYHLDAYRADNSAAFAALGWEELLEQEGLIVLEWAARVRNLWPADYLHLQAHIINADARRWRAVAHGDRSMALLKALAAASAPPTISICTRRVNVQHGTR
jgi:tRNA threonylcarbamoyladenosine biosynthesis protein TsaE